MLAVVVARLVLGLEERHLLAVVLAAQILLPEQMERQIRAAAVVAVVARQPLVAMVVQA
jgi:hypothetical protein